MSSYRGGDKMNRVEEAVRSIIPPPRPARTMAQFRFHDPVGWQILRHLLRRWNIKMNMPGALDESLMHTEDLLDSGRMRYHLTAHEDEIILAVDFWAENAYRSCGSVSCISQATLN